MRSRRLLLFSVGLLLSGLALAAEPPRPAKEPHGKVLRFRIGHNYSLADAHARLQLLFDYWKQRYGVIATWIGDEAHLRGSVWGVQFVGAIAIQKNMVVANATDPGVFFRGTAYNYIDRKLKKYLHPTYQEE